MERLINNVGFLELIEFEGIFVESDDFVTEDGIGEFNSKKKGGIVIRVDVYSDEGDHIPHFHFQEDGESKPDLDGCVELYRSEYFKHGKHKSTLTDSQAKIMDKWLRKPSTKANGRELGLTNWEFAVYTWKKSKGNKNKGIEVEKQPNYSKINDALYYRIYTRNGVGIYEALKKAAGREWGKLISKKEFTWLPKPKDYPERAISFFKNAGYEKFMKHTWKYVIKYIDPDYIVQREESNIGGKTIYEDDYQIVIIR